MITDTDVYIIVYRDLEESADSYGVGPFMSTEQAVEFADTRLAAVDVTVVDTKPDWCIIHDPYDSYDPYDV